MTTTDRWAMKFNFGAKVVTGIFLLYLAVVTLAVSVFGPLFTVTTPYHPLVGSFSILADAIVGFRVVSMFGGRQNFIGRLVLYYSVSLMSQGFGWIVWGLFAGGSIPTGSTLILLLFGSILGQAISSYALLRSAKAIVIKVDRRVISLVLLALILSVALSVSVWLYFSSPSDRLVWGGIWPTLIFLQLASGLVLVSSMGRWYLAKPLANITYAFILYPLAASLITTLSAALRWPLQDYWVIVAIMTASCFFLAGLGMTQVKPMSLILSAETSEVSPALKTK